MRKLFYAFVAIGLGGWLNGAAATPATSCGTFSDKETENLLVFQADGSAREYAKNGTVQAVMYHYKQDAKLFLRNVENGYTKQLQMSDDGTELKEVGNKWGSTVYARQESYTCAPVSAQQYLGRAACDYGKEAKCCADGDTGACVKAAADTDNVSELKRWCETRADACIDLIGAYEKQANPRSGATFSMYAEKKPLPQEQLNEAAQMCQRHRSPDLCNKALEQIWRGQQFELGREMLSAMCDAHLDDKACERFDVLDQIEFPAQLPASTGLPCGEYFSTVSSLTGDLKFGDRGMVKFGFGISARARLEDGLIKIRHDKGGDFVFARLNDDQLIGLDTWNQYELYQRDAKPRKACAAPIVYKEVPLSDTCGLDKDPAQCCKAGDTQGCNRLANMAAMGGNWKGAAQMYAKVCAKGVRVGCENWAYTISKTGDSKGVQKGMKQLCSADKRHVTCDVLETTNFGMFMMSYELEKMSK